LFYAELIFQDLSNEKRIQTPLLVLVEHFHLKNNYCRAKHQQGRKAVLEIPGFKHQPFLVFFSPKCRAYYILSIDM
jgi:hypothetical protein